MKILHLHDSPHLHGGATQYLNQSLQALKGRDVRSYLFSIGPQIESPFIEHHFAFEYSLPPSRLQRRRDFYGNCASLRESLAAALAESAADLIHVHNCANFRSTVFSTILNSNLPSIMTVHDFSLDWKSSPQRRDGGAKAFVANQLNRRQHQRSRQLVIDSIDLFLCPTQAILDGLNLPSAKSRVHRLPIAEAECSELAKNKLRMLFAGTLFHSKGVDVLLEALRALNEHDIDFSLEIAGSGDLASQLQAICSEFGISDRVEFLGQLDGHQMNLAYQRANLLVLPSRVPENSPLTVLEAGARGRPAVASHAGGVPELIDSSRGWTFPSENSAELANILRSIADDLSIIAIRGQKMRKWVRNEFAPAGHWQQLEQHYNSLIS